MRSANLTKNKGPKKIMDDYKSPPPKKSYKLSSCCAKCQAELGGDYFNLLQKNYYIKLENKALKSLLPPTITLKMLTDEMNKIISEEEKR